MENTENGTVPIHDNDEVTRSRGILTPIIQCCTDSPGNPILLFNLYSEKSRRETILGILECSKKQLQGKEEECWAITNFVSFVGSHEQASSAVMFHPIHPADDPTDVTGFIISPMLWTDIFVSTSTVFYSS